MANFGAMMSLPNDHLYSWRFKPFVHTLTFHLASIAIMGSLEKDVDYLAARLALQAN